MSYKNVKVLKYPISDRYCHVGATAQLDTKNSKIRVGGAWFDFDKRWEVKEEYQPKKKSIKPWVYNTIREQLLKFKGRKNMAFATIINSQYTVGIAERGTRGYTPTSIVIPELQYDDAKDIVDELNEDILELDPKEAIMIVVETMRQ